MSYLRFILIYLTFNLLVSNLLFAATPPKYRHGGLKASLSSEYFSTQENYDNISGQFKKLTNNNELSYYKMSPHFLYGLNNKWGVSGQLDFISGSSKASNLERSANQFTDIHSSVYYKIIKNKFYILPQFKISVPITTYDEGQDDVILNDGAMSIELGTWVERKWLHHRLYIYGGYKILMDGRAHLIPLEAGIYNSHKGFIYGLAFLGNEVATNDEYLETPQNRFNRTDQLNAGSLKFYSINPKTMSLAGWLGYRISKNIVAQAKVESTVNGSNSAKGNTFSINIKWRAIKSHKKSERPANDNFKLEGVDIESPTNEDSSIPD